MNNRKAIEQNSKKRNIHSAVLFFGGVTIGTIASFLILSTSPKTNRDDQLKLTKSCKDWSEKYHNLATEYVRLKFNYRTMENRCAELEKETAKYLDLLAERDLLKFNYQVKENEYAELEKETEKYLDLLIDYDSVKFNYQVQANEYAKLEKEKKELEKVLQQRQLPQKIK